MTDLPKRIEIHEEGPREGFQIEAGPIAPPTKCGSARLWRKPACMTCSACRSSMLAACREWRTPWRSRKPSGNGPTCEYTAIALNLRGYERAMQTPLHITGGIQMSTSNTFSIHNTNKNNEETLIEQRRQLEFFKARGIPVESAIVMTAFGCNFEGEIAPETVRDCVGKLLGSGRRIRHHAGSRADRRYGRLGVARFRAARRRDGPGKMARSETGAASARHARHRHGQRADGHADGDRQFRQLLRRSRRLPVRRSQGRGGEYLHRGPCVHGDEMGIETGIDLDALIECARMAEDIVGHPLPGKVMHGGSLSKYRHGAPA